MTTQNRITKTRAVIQGVLALLGHKTGRTKLVKLVYLADIGFYESTGRTITGNLYMWDHYGPNAVSHAIANEANELASTGPTRMAVRSSMYGGDAYEYWVDDPDRVWESVAAVLDDGERQILMDVTRQFKHSTMASIVSRSKETRPFINAQQYDVLQLEQDERVRQIRERLGLSEELLEEVELGLKDADQGRWVWGEELEPFDKS